MSHRWCRGLRSGLRLCVVAGLSWASAAVLTFAAGKEPPPERSLEAAVDAYCERSIEIATRSAMDRDGSFDADAAEPGPAMCWDDDIDPLTAWLHVRKYCDSSAKSDSVCDRLPFFFPAVVAFDHGRKQWGVESGIEEKLVKKDVSGIPLIPLGRKQTLVVLIENTNPLLYTAAVTESADADLPQIANLGVLVSLLGGFAQGLVAVVAPEDYQPLVEGKTRVDSANDAVRKLDDALAGIRKLIQQVENGHDRTTDCEFFAPALETIHEHGDHLRTLRKELESEFDGGAAEDIGKALVAYLALLDAEDKKREASKETLLGLMGSSQYAEVLAAFPLESSQRHTTLLQSAITIKDAGTQLLEREFRQSAEFQRQLVEGTLARRKAVAELLKAWPEAEKGAAQAETFARRCKQALVGDEIATWMLVDHETPPIKRTKRQTHKITISRASLFADAIVPTPERPKELTTSYRLEWDKASILGVGFALTSSSLESPTFSAVTDPVDPDNPMETDPLVIAQTGSESRAAELAVFANLEISRLWKKWRHRPVQLSFDVGAGLDVGTPAAFAGFSLGYKYVRLGGGWTWQEVKALDGQAIGMPIGSSEDIKTRNTFENDTYWSLMLSLGDLPFFNKKE